MEGRCGLDLKHILDQVAVCRFKPTQDLSVSFISWVVLVAVLYISFSFGGRLGYLLYPFPVLLLVGAVFPAFWMVRVRGRSLSEIGLKRRYWLLSLVIGLVATALFDVPRLLVLTWMPELIPIFVLAVVSGFFEAIFFSGWLQLRLEESFGVIPAILVASFYYSLYHIGYGGSWIDVDTLITLFYVGVFFACIFRLTKNILTVWPFLIPLGAVYDLVKHGTWIPFDAVYGFILAFMLMVAALLYLHRVELRKLK